MGPATLGSKKVIENKATRPDKQRYDRVDIYTVPRWKESELSGDEYRISCNADLYYKGNLIKQMNFSDVDTAIRYLDGALVYWRENGESFDHVDDSYLCDQESCASIADVKYKRLDAWTSHGDKEYPDHYLNTTKVTDLVDSTDGRAKDKASRELAQEPEGDNNG